MDDNGIGKLSKPRPAAVLWLFSAALAFFLFAQTQAFGQKGGLLRISQAVDVENLDPAIARTVEDAGVIEQIFEGLTAYDPADASAVPAAAKSWKISADLKTYTFNLRKNARWSDGSPLRAEDFVYSFQRILTPETASPWAYELFNVRGARDFYEGKTKDFLKVGVIAKGPHTLEIVLERPQPYLLGWLAHSSMMPVKKETLQKHGAKWTHPDNIVSNGAFILTYRRPKDRVVLKKNDRYWDAKNVFLKEVHYYAIEDESTGLKMYETGLLDIAGGGLPPERLESFRGRGDFFVSNYLGTYFYRFNTLKKPFDDVNVRRAFNMAVDKSVITDKILRGGQNPATGLVPDGISWYSPAKGDSYDAALAKKLLDEAGYCTTGISNARCRPFPKTELLFNTLGNHRKIAQAVQAMLKQNLGVEISTVNMDYKTVQARAKEGKFDIVRGGWIGDYVDPVTFISLFGSDSGNNLTGWTSKEFDAILKEAENAGDSKRRAELLSKAESIINRELPILPIYFFTRIYLKKEYVKGYYPNILDKHPLKNVRF